MVSSNCHLPGFYIGWLQIQEKSEVAASEGGNRHQSSCIILNMKFLVLTVLSAIVISLLEAQDIGQVQCPADEYEPWTYRGRSGPEFWELNYPSCNGLNQSPIDIDSRNVQTDENLAQMTLVNYHIPVFNATMENNGHTIKIRPQDQPPARTIEVKGEIYTLDHLHFHWGLKSSEGSEHTIDGVQYAMEMHLVHLSNDEKIAVVGIFFQEQLQDNADLQPIVDQLDNVRYQGSETVLASPLNLNNLLPANPTHFYRYDGSLTTPGCAEGVTWSVVSKPMPVGKAQMLKFRSLSSATQDSATPGCTMAGNYRPVQPINTRQVYNSTTSLS